MTVIAARILVHGIALAAAVNGLRVSYGFQKFLNSESRPSTTPKTLESEVSIQSWPDHLMPGVIAGGSLFQYCPDSSDSDLYDVDWVTFFPNPPILNQAFRFQMNGTFRVDVSANASVFLNTTVWPDPNDPKEHAASESWDLDLCYITDTIEQLNATSQTNAQCPPKQGLGLITTWMFVPWIAPVRNWTIYIDAKTVNGDRLFCITGDTYIVKYDDWAVARASSSAAKNGDVVNLWRA